jgi:hypothetical protein
VSRGAMPEVAGTGSAAKCRSGPVLQAKYTPFFLTNTSKNLLLQVFVGVLSESTVRYCR